MTQQVFEYGNDLSNNNTTDALLVLLSNYHTKPRPLPSPQQFQTKPRVHLACLGATTLHQGFEAPQAFQAFLQQCSK